MSSSETPEYPSDLIINEDLQHLIDTEVSIAVVSVCKYILRNRGIHNAIFNYSLFMLPSKISESIDRVSLNLKEETSRFDYTDTEYKSIRNGLIAGFITGRRMVSLRKSPQMTNYLNDVLQGVYNLVKNHNFDLEELMLANTNILRYIDRRFTNAGISDVAYPDDGNFSEKKLFHIAATFLGGSALSYVIADRTSNLDPNTKVYFMQYANMLAHEIKTEEVGR